MTKGVLYIISAPSGTGKSSLIKALIKTKKFYNNVHVSVSYTTRTIRIKEIHGKHYFFISTIEFKRMIKKNAFLEYAYIFNNYYGTLRKNIEKMLSMGIDIILNINWKGAKKIRNQIPYTRSIFILPPSKEVLYHRLHKRGQDSEETINKRMKYAISEISHFSEYDYLIINDNFKKALLDLKNIIFAERLCINRQKLYYKKLIKDLLIN